MRESSIRGSEYPPIQESDDAKPKARYVYLTDLLTLLTYSLYLLPHLLYFDTQPISAVFRAFRCPKGNRSMTSDLRTRETENAFIHC